MMRSLLEPLKLTWRPTSIVRGLSWRYFGYVIVLLYILGFPTIVSVMTGYQTASTPSVERPGIHNLMNVSDLTIPPLVVRDGHRIGLEKDTPIYRDNPNFVALLARTLIIATCYLTGN